MMKSDGTVWGAGINTFGQLGIHKTKFVVMPNFEEAFPRGATAVSAGGGHSMVIKKDGSVWSTGVNMYGQIGDGSNIDRDSFVTVISRYRFGKAVAAGAHHSLVVTHSGNLVATGLNAHGQLGDGTLTNTNIFVSVLSGAMAVAAGGGHSMALKRDGSVWMAGKNKHGQLGDGSGHAQRRFVPVIFGGAKAMAAGNSHSMVLKEEGSVLVTGENKYGQLGDGTLDLKLSFVQVMSSGVEAIAAGYDHSMVLKEDGSVWATGRNNFGQLGIELQIESFTSTFTQVISSSVQTVAAGTRFSMVLKHDGSLWATGANDCGQLGDGSTVAKSKYTRISLTSEGACSNHFEYQRSTCLNVKYER